MPATPTKAQLREIVAEVLHSETDLAGFVLDHFEEVHGKFADGMNRVAKVNLLLQHAEAEDIFKILMGRHPGKTLRVCQRAHPELLFEHELSDPGPTRAYESVVPQPNGGSSEIIAEAREQMAPAPARAIETPKEVPAPRVVIPASALPRRSIIEAAIVGLFIVGGAGIYADLRSKITGLEEEVAGSKEALTRKINGSEKRLDEKIGGIGKRLGRLEDRYNQKFGADTRSDADGGAGDAGLPMLPNAPRFPPN